MITVSLLSALLLTSVSAPHPGVTLVRRGSAAMTITDLCAAGVSVRATRYAERKQTPGQWAQNIGAQVAINADFFDFPGWSWVLVRARGDGEDWPAPAMRLEQPSSYWKFGAGFAGVEANSLVPPGPEVTQAVGAYDLLIDNGQIHDFTGETFMLNSYRRSAIGISRDHNTLFFYASAAAINGHDMAAEMISMAAEAGAPGIDFATNEDGGGSSQLYVQGLGQVIDSGRQVNTHLGVYARGSGPATHCHLPSRSNNASGSLASWSGDRLDYFFQRDDDQMGHRGWSGLDWGPVDTLGGNVKSGPVVASWGPGRLDSFALGVDGRLKHQWWGGAPPFSGVEDHPGALSSPPAVTSWGLNRLDVFALGADSSMLHKAWNGVAWSDWEPHGGRFLYKPSVTAWAANRLDVFVVNEDRSLAHQWWDGTAWSGWEQMGGALASAPTVVSWGPNRLDVFARGTDAALWHRAFTGTGWTGWENLGGVIVGEPSVCAWSVNRLDIVALGPDGTVHHKYWNGSAFSEWESLGGALLEPADVIAWGPNRLDLFGIGVDQSVQHKAWTGQGWTGWESLGGRAKRRWNTIVEPPRPGVVPNPALPVVSSGSGMAATSPADAISGGCASAGAFGPSFIALVLAGLTLRRRSNAVTR